jgi:hypothetical protein
MSELLLTNGTKGIGDGVYYDDGTSIPLQDFLTVEQGLAWPEKIIRIEYVPDERLSFFTEDGQFGPPFPFEGRWDIGDQILAKRQQYVDAIAAAKPKPPAPQPPVDPRAGLKSALDTFLAGDGTDRAALKAVLQQWRNSLTAFLLVLGLGSPAWAYEHYSNVAQDQNGHAVVGASVTVYRAGTTNLATLYSDNGLTPKSNPFTTALDGIYDFYAPDGLYDIKLSKTGYSSVYWDANKTKGIALFDPSHFMLPYGDTFPTGPNVGDWFVLTNDNGFCTALSGSSNTPCRWSGSSWDPMGGGGGAGGSSGLGPNFNVTGGNIITGSSEARKWTLLGTGPQAPYGGVKYQSSSGKWVENCLGPLGEGDCDKYVELNSGKKWGIRDDDGNIQTEFDNDTAKFTKLTFNCEDSGVNCTRYYKFCGGDLVGVDPASGTAGHIWDKSPLGTAPTATAVTGTNQTYGVARFPDTDGDYGVQLTCLLPPGFTGNLDAVAWGKTTGTGNFRLQIATVCYATGEANDAAFNTASIYTMAAGTSGRLTRYSLSNITKTGCAANEAMFVRVFRNRTEASDTLNNTFDLKVLELWGRNTD